MNILAEGMESLVGITEIAERSGVTRAAVCNWRYRQDGFPEPLAVLAFGSIWWWPQIKQWLTQTGRRYDCLEAAE